MLMQLLLLLLAGHTANDTTATAATDGHDEELYVIADFLEKTKDVSDVRDYVEFWREGAEVISENNQDPETAST
eukprot:10539-Heterococcus_DN1.PRE.1